jgi:hypothetical protein
MRNILIASVIAVAAWFIPDTVSVAKDGAKGYAGSAEVQDLSGFVQEYQGKAPWQAQGLGASGFSFSDHLCKLEKIADAAEQPTATYTHPSMPALTYTPILTVSPASTSTSTSTPTETSAPAETSTPASVLPASMTLEDFTQWVRGRGYDGLWSSGRFGYMTYEEKKWGQVPATDNFASHSNLFQYSAYFIHEYNGGDQLFYVPIGAKVAAITKDSIRWYAIDGIYKYLGTQSNKWCGYLASGPFYDSAGLKKSPDDILSAHYLKPLVIQTCYCEDPVGGVFILTGSKTDAP